MDTSSGKPGPKNNGSLRLFLFFTALFIAIFLVPSVAGAFDLKDKVKEFTLDNGMKVIVLERSRAPIFAAKIMYKAGAVEEPSGYTGMAHMLEHMLFKGTTTIGTKDWEKEKPLLEKVNKIGDELDRARRNGADDKKIKSLEEELKKAQAEEKQYVMSEAYSTLYSAEGGVGLNASTSKDSTSYVIRLPADKLELFASLESARMRDAVLREYYSERDVVLEELRMRYKNSGTGKLYERYLASAFIAHPYGRPVIGWESDITLLPLAKVEQFLKTWYVPNNAIMALVGDVHFDEVKRVVTKYFGAIPAKPLPDRIVTEEPPQGGERRIEVEFDANPTFFMGFHKPVAPNPDDYVISVIDSVLSTSRTGRFDENIVRKKKMAASIGTFNAPGERYPNLYTIVVEPLPPHATEDVERAVWEELEKLKTEPVPEDDLARIKNKLEADFIHSLVSDSGMASLLSQYQILHGDWRQILVELEKIKSVTAEDIQRVAKKYFTRDNLTVASIVQSKNED